MSSICALLNWSPNPGILPPNGSPLSIIVRREVAIGWCQAWAVPFSGGEGYFPCASAFLQSGVPDVSGLWQLAQSVWYSVSPLFTCAELYQRPLKPAVVPLIWYPYPVNFRGEISVIRPILPQKGGKYHLNEISESNPNTGNELNIVDILAIRLGKISGLAKLPGPVHADIRRKLPSTS